MVIWLDCRCFDEVNMAGRVLGGREMGRADRWNAILIALEEWLIWSKMYHLGTLSLSS